VNHEKSNIGTLAIWRKCVPKRYEILAFVARRKRRTEILAQPPTLIPRLDIKKQEHQWIVRKSSARKKQKTDVTGALSVKPKCTIRSVNESLPSRTLDISEPAFSDLFVAYMVDRYNRTQADLVDQLFNSAEKRLARTLLLLARIGKEGKSENVVPR
jgi:hypothetical protein